MSCRFAVVHVPVKYLNHCLPCVKTMPFLGCSIFLPQIYHILGKLHGLKTQICFAALTGYWWLLKTSDSECYQETHMLPQGMQFALQAFSFQTGLSVAKLFSTTQRTSRIIFNWRLKASHNQMTEEMGLSDKWKTPNDFRFNHKRTKCCV